MADECEENMRKIAEGFRECRRAFTAIGDETRQLILLALLESDIDGIRVGEIAAKAHLTRPSVAHHLRILKEAGIVSVRKDGTKNFYYIGADRTQWREIAELVNLIGACVDEIGAHGQTDKVL